MQMDKAVYWKRGFLRIWILVSVLWIGFISANTYDSILNPTISNGREHIFLHVGDSNQIDKELKAVSERSKADQIQEGMEEFFKNGGLTRISDPKELREIGQLRENGKLIKIRIDSNSKIYLYVSPSDSESEVEHKVEEAVAVSSRVNSLLKARKRRNAIVDIVQVAVIPPVAILLFGLAIGWIVSGFRRPA